MLEAEARASDARDRARAIAHVELVDRAQFLVARALEQEGAIDSAILELEPLVAEPVGSMLCIRAAIALSRCYRESGDLGLAIDLGERVLQEMSAPALDSADEAVQLAVTVAAAYYERGDTGQAVRTCRKAIDKAEQLDSPKARASAYWNASMMEARRLGPQRDPARRARAGAAGRRPGRRQPGAIARWSWPSMQLRLDPPEVAGGARTAWSGPPIGPA